MAKLTAQYDYSSPQEYLALLYEARAAASQGKSYAIRGKTYTRQDLETLRSEIAATKIEIARASGRSTVCIGQHVRSAGRPNNDIEFRD